MSPFPEQLIDRWRDGYGDATPERGLLWWLVLLDSSPQLRAAAQAAQSRISSFPGLHMTPLHRLHLSVLIAGPADEIPEHARSEMLAIARSYLAGTGPIIIEFSRIFYHPEAIVLTAHPAEALSPIREAAQRATQAVTGHSGTDDRSSPQWIPHVTLCYSTSVQPAQPIIAALGKRLPSCQATIDTLSLVAQQGAEHLWNWSLAGAVSLPGCSPARLADKARGTSRTPSDVGDGARSGAMMTFASATARQDGPRRPGGSVFTFFRSGRCGRFWPN
jgi:2'-5' RNA ligase